MRWVEDACGWRRKGLLTAPALLHSVRFVGGGLLDAESSRDWIAEVLSAAGLAGDGSHQAQCAHHWRRGDFLLWDNRCVLHRVLPPLSWTGIRLQHQPLWPGASRCEGPAVAAELEAAVADSLMRSRSRGGGS